jgi:hypothetical protein
MGFTGRKGISFKSLFSVIICLWLHGNNGEESGFKIYRGERDIFTNLDYDEISGTSSGSGTFIDQCSSYGAECVDDQCKYCRCRKGKNTFMLRDPDQMDGYCKSDEDIVPGIYMCTLIFTVDSHCLYEMINEYTWCFPQTKRYIVLSPCKLSRNINFVRRLRV